LSVSAAAYHTAYPEAIGVLFSEALRFVIYVGGMETGERANGLAQQDLCIAGDDVIGQFADALVAQAFIQALGVDIERRDTLDPLLASAKRFLLHRSLPRAGEPVLVL
jgi:hypothetical protein